MGKVHEAIISYENGRITDILVRAGLEKGHADEENCNVIERIRHKTYVDELLMHMPDKDFKSGICICTSNDPFPYHELVKLLHPQEMGYYDSLAFEKRKKSYLIGRYAAKHAIAALAGDKCNLHAMVIQQGVFNQPVATLGYEQNIQVSISHCDDLGAALAFPEAHPMGIDIEKVQADKCRVMESQMTQAEKNMITHASCSYDRLLTLLWTAKEALSKILRTGLTTPFHVFEIDKIESKSDHSICFFENFGQYKAISFDVGVYVCSLVIPDRTEISIDIPRVRRVLETV